MGVFPEIVPRAGEWSATGGDRDYDWIGPNSTLPGAGQVFAAFDRYFPFTKWITKVRDFFGAGDDEHYRGPQTVVVGDCGMTLTTRGLTLAWDGTSYTSTQNIEGTLHEMRLEVASPYEMIERWTYSVGANTDLPAEMQQQVEEAGVAGLFGAPIRMEVHEPVRWRHTGEETPVDWIADCCAMMAAARIFVDRVRNAFADDGLYEQVMAENYLLTPSAQADAYVDAVWVKSKLDTAALEMVVPGGVAMTEFLAAMDHITFRIFTSEHTGKPAAQVAGSVSSSGQVTVNQQDNELKEALIRYHEEVHVEQRRQLIESMDESDPALIVQLVDDKFGDPEWFRVAEIEAYESEMAVIDAWLATYC